MRRARVTYKDAYPHVIKNQPPFPDGLLLKKLPLLIIIFGIIFRIAQYLFNRSLTEGEAALAMNIVHRSYTELLKPLDYVQAAPIGFLLVQKIMVNLFGNNEYSMRIFPLIAGIISLFLFYMVVKRFLTGWAVPISLIIFATNDHLIYFSSEIKQYSSDVTFSLLLYFIALDIIKMRLSVKKTALLGFMGAIIIWFSHPSVFTFFSIIIILTILIIRTFRWHNLIGLAVAWGVWALNLIIDYSYFLLPLTQNRELLDYWQSSFMPLGIKSIADIRWFVYSFARIFKNPLGFGIYGLSFSIFLFIVGCIVFFKKSKRDFTILILPAILTLFSSGLHKYPFEGRLLLFLVPSMIIVITAGLDFIRDKLASSSKLISSLLVIMFLVYPVTLAGYRLVKPRGSEELRPVMNYLKLHYQEGDLIYLYYGARNGFLYYADKINFQPGDYVIVGNTHSDKWDDYYWDLLKLKGNKRVWVVFSHIITWRGVDEERLFLSYLNLLGTMVTSFRTSGASVYLYDLSEQTKLRMNK